MPTSIVECCDNMEFMSRFPDGFFQVALIDPPYNIASQQKRGVGSRIDASGKMNEWNGTVPSEEYFKELFRVSENQIVWGANNFTMPPSEYFCIWNKHQTVDNFASAEYAWVSPGLKKPAKVFEYTIHQHNIDKGAKIHSTMKPIKLYKWLLKNYAKPGDKILDTHMGSQSSRIASYDMGFDYWGCEIDPDYFKSGCERFEKECSHLNLFHML